MCKFYILCVFLFFYHQVECRLKCYECVSTKSLEDCENKQHATDGCVHSKDSSKDTCYVFQSVSKDGKASYGKSCMTRDTCTENYGCYANSSFCKVKCCMTAECNIDASSVGSLLRPSLFLITLIAIMLMITSWQTVK